MSVELHQPSYPNPLELAWKCTTAQTFPFAVFVQSFYQYLWNRSTFSSSNISPTEHSQVGSLLQKGSRKGLVLNIIYTSAKHANLIHDVTYTTCQAQNSSIHSHVFATFKQIAAFTAMFLPLSNIFSFIKLDEKPNEKLLRLFFFYILFWLIGPMMPFSLLNQSNSRPICF